MDALVQIFRETSRLGGPGELFDGAPSGGFRRQISVLVLPRGVASETQGRPPG